ncbi:hypothetical protein SAMN05421768_10670 [Chryseobacterium joostei]|nr:hypothetical protein SAMN05421768_10670 [Chryseobacterium joostei]
MIDTLKMEQTDDIDILLTLNPHGWSTCFLVDKGKAYEFTITHVFSDPYFDLIQVLTSLINGQKFATLFWYGEPGGHRFEFTTQHDIILVSVDEFGETFDEEPKLCQLMFLFEIKLKQLITIFYLQLQKTRILLLDKNFAENRERDFPFQEFHKFERLVKQFLDL